MLYFKDINALEKRVQRGANWDDYFMLGISGPNYVYFVNKKTHDAIKVDYICPSTNWQKIPTTCRDGKPHVFKKGDRKHGNMDYCKKCDRTEREQVQTAVYRFLGLEFIPDMYLWRTDTL